MDIKELIKGLITILIDKDLDKEDVIEPMLNYRDGDTYDYTNKEETIGRYKSLHMGHSDDMDKYILSEIKDLEFAYDNPESTVEIRFHGGCSSCQSIAKNGLKGCYGCQYFTCDWDLENLNTK